MNERRPRPTEFTSRSGPRIQSLREITVSYEGQDERIVVKPPNLSARGMFINTSRCFPEGAVLNVRFGLLRTGAEIQTRCEVRYCEPGVGVGVEFIGLLPEDRETIEQEILFSGTTSRMGKPRVRRTKRRGTFRTKRRV